MPVKHKTMQKNQTLDSFLKMIFYCGGCNQKMKKIDGKDKCVNKKCENYYKNETFSK